MPEFKPLEDGPLLVAGLTNLRGAEGSIDAPADCALCRCGASRNKPFCDGSHKSIGFSSAKLDDRTPDRRDDYVGAEITVHDNRGTCAHAGVCTERLPSVWRMKQEPWIEPDGAPASEIAAVVRACPSGALSFSAHDEDAPATVSSSVHVAPKGPYVVQGPHEVVGEATGDRCTLCRCGGSKNKPFCDGTHWAIEFEG